MSWKDDTKSLIKKYQGLDKYAKYADLEDFLQWLDAEGHKEIAKHIRENGNNKNRD